MRSLWLRIEPPLVTTIVKYPVPTERPPLRPATATGCVLLVMVPTPACPYELSPQVNTVPSLCTAAELYIPAEIEMARPMTETCIGTPLDAVLPSPS